MNKSSIENEERLNGLIGDFEKVSKEVLDIQSKIQNTDFSSGEETTKLMRQLNDLEANVNTSLITEKSVRKAQDKHLA